MRGLIGLPFVLVFATGCGPLIFPAVQRLQPKEQATVDAEWNNMLTPPDRLDRDVLLDTISMFGLIQLGVDRFTMKSEKGYAGGRVVMQVRFDRSSPRSDLFTIELYDRRGRRIRVERYSGEEVMNHVMELWAWAGRIGSTTQPESSEQRILRERYDARIARVMAATQPAK